MDDSTFWWDEAVKFRDRARKTDDHTLHEELLDLAAVCEEVAATMSERAPSG